MTDQGLERKIILFRSLERRLIKIVQGCMNVNKRNFQTLSLVHFVQENKITKVCGIIEESHSYRTFYSFWEYWFSNFKRIPIIPSPSWLSPVLYRVIIDRKIDINRNSIAYNGLNDITIDCKYGAYMWWNAVWFLSWIVYGIAIQVYLKLIQSGRRGYLFKN